MVEESLSGDEVWGAVKRVELGREAFIPSTEEAEVRKGQA